MGLLDEPEYKALQNQVHSLHEQSSLLKDLFGSASNVAMLNRAAPQAFATIQHTFIDGLILGIVRIVHDNDPRSLTLNALKGHSTKTVERELSAILKILRRRTSKLCDHRNARIGHHNKSVANGLMTLSALFVDDIEAPLGLIREFMNKVSKSNGGPEIGYQNVITQGDGKHLARIVKLGLEKIDEIHGA